MPLKLSDKVNFGLVGARDREKAKNLEEKKNKGRRTNSNNAATAQSKPQTKNPSGVDEALLDNELAGNNNTISRSNANNNKSTASGQHQQDSTSPSSTQRHREITQHHIEPSDVNASANLQMMEEEENEKVEENKTDDAQQVDEINNEEQEDPLDQVVAMNGLELAVDQESDDEHEERTRDVDVQQAVEPKITALFKHPDTIAYAKKLCRYFPYAMEMVATGRIESSKHLLFDGQNIYSLDGEKRKLVSELQEKYKEGDYVHDSILKRFVEKDLEAEARAVENPRA